tara:strand:+ start:84 stop:296 length:213 start_codon:yes stop_codon:yes gene_type:complete
MIKESKPVRMLTVDGQFICEFKNLRTCADWLVEHGHRKDHLSAKAGVSAIINKQKYYETIGGLFSFEYAP